MKANNIFFMLATCTAMACCFSSCEKVHEEIPDRGNTMISEMSEYDIDMKDFAKAVHLAIVNNGDLRERISSEALKQFDGDYDVLLTTISCQTVQVDDAMLKTKTGNDEMTVKELLDSYYDSFTETKSANSIIEELQNKYPDLQVSVPVHAEEWDPETYIPVVAFRPSDYDDATVETIPGYDSEGNYIDVDAINIPEDPVIVIGLNERIGTGDGMTADTANITYPPVTIIDGGNVHPVSPSAPYGLNAQPTENSIFLSWEQNGEPNTYYVYRKAQNETEYAKIGTISGADNKSYEDRNLSPSMYYSYYVTSAYVSVTRTSGLNPVKIIVSESDPSSSVLVQAPEIPDALSHFEARLAGDKVELRWNNDKYTESETHIKYMVPEFFTTYRELGTEPTPADNLIYNSSYKGTRVMYKATRENNMGVSDSKYDYIYPPYRNADKPSPVYIKQIKFTDWSLERWPAGKAEFCLKVLGVNDDGQTIELQKEMLFNFDNGSSTSQVFTGRKALDWLYLGDDDWYSALTFYMEEYDRDTKAITFTIAARLNIKLLEILEASFGAEATVSFMDRGEICGTTYLNYFDNPEQWLSFPNYGVEMLISENE